MSESKYYNVFIGAILIAKDVPEPYLMLVVRGLLTEYDWVTISEAGKATGNG